MQVESTTLELRYKPVDNINTMVNKGVYETERLNQMNKEIPKNLSSNKMYAGAVLAATIGLAILFGITNPIAGIAIGICAIVPLAFLINATNESYKWRESAVAEFANVATIYDQMAGYFIEQQKIREGELKPLLEQNRTPVKEIETANKETHKKVIEIAEAIQRMGNPYSKVPSISTAWSNLQRKCRIYIRPSDYSDSYMYVNRNFGYGPPQVSSFII